MILLVHMIFGAAIGFAVKNAPLAIILAFLSHYFLDFFPHAEYDISGKKMTVVLKVAADFSLGILLIFILSGIQPIIYICAFFAILPDGLTVLNYIMPNKILSAHYKLHQKIHFFKDKKISRFWRTASQVIAVVVSVALFRI